MRSPFVYPVLSYRVIDGDTIEVWLDLGYNLRMEQVVRLSGVDAPELHAAAERPAALAVQAAVVAWLASQPAEQLRCESQEVEKYGRTLGDFLNAANGKRLTEELLARGLVHRYSGEGPRPPWFAEELRRIESQAKQEKST